jgi:hypothetical protein
VVTQNPDGTWSATIGDKNFDFSKWGAEKALLTFAEISRIAAAGLGDASIMLNQANRDELAGTIVSLIVKGIGEGLGGNPKQTLALVKRLCCDDVHCDGQPMRHELFDTFFREDIFFAFEVARAALEVQYSSFFKRLAPGFALIRDKLKENTSASNTTT